MHLSAADTACSTIRLIDEGGDWDRRNRLKVYQGLHLLTIRDFKKGGELLIDALSTFTASELLDYDSFVTITVLSCMVWMERTDIKKKVRHSSFSSTPSARV